MKFKKVEMTLEEDKKKVTASYSDGSVVSFIVGEDNITSELEEVLRDIYIQYELFIPKEWWISLK